MMVQIYCPRTSNAYFINGILELIRLSKEARNSPTNPLFHLRPHPPPPPKAHELRHNPYPPIKDSHGGATAALKGKGPVSCRNNEAPTSASKSMGKMGHSHMFPQTQSAIDYALKTTKSTKLKSIPLSSSSRKPLRTLIMEFVAYEQLFSLPAEVQ
jgi:hypothetical protein